MMTCETTELGTEQVSDLHAKVLVVDDECGPRESLRLILSPGYNVIVATNGLEALKRFDDEHPDMIISDIRMPRMDGIQLLRNIKERSPETPFILITGFGTLESAQEAVRMGAYDYISKPYDVGDIRRVVTKALDDSRRKREREQALQNLQETNSDLERSLQELDQKASIGDLSAEMIHDLNNPICALQGYVELLECTLAEQVGFAASEEKEFLNVIKQQACRCIELTRRFLDYARVDGDIWSLDDINSLLQDTLFVFGVRLRALGIQLRTELAEELPATWVQTSQLQQVFYNLITNAIHAMEDSGSGGALTVRTEVVTEPGHADADTAVRITISDTGPGIPADMQDQIFARFFTTKQDGRGTGLGLPICRRIIEAHKGRLDLDSEENKGATFYVSIPILDAAPDLA